MELPWELGPGGLTPKGRAGSAQAWQLAQDATAAAGELDRDLHALMTELTEGGTPRTAFAAGAAARAAAQAQAQTAYPSAAQHLQPIYMLSLQQQYSLASGQLVQAACSEATDSARGTAAAAEASDTQGTGRDGKSKQRRGPRPRMFKKNTCQADSCSEDLSQLSFYYQRNHICPAHLKSEAYPCRGVDTRFCQRCGVGHPLPEFEGAKRSCRKALEKHNSRRRERQSLRAPSAGGSAGGTGAAYAASPSAQASPQAGAGMEMLGHSLQRAALPRGWETMAAQQAAWQQQREPAALQPVQLQPLLPPGMLAGLPGSPPSPFVAQEGPSGEEDSGGQVSQQLLPPGAGGEQGVGSGSDMQQPGAGGAAGTSFAELMQAPVVSAPLPLPLELHGSSSALAPQLLPPASQPLLLQQQQQQQPGGHQPSQWVLLPRHVLDALIASAGGGAAVAAALGSTVPAAAPAALEQAPLDAAVPAAAMDMPLDWCYEI